LVIAYIIHVDVNAYRHYYASICLSCIDSVVVVFVW